MSPALPTTLSGQLREAGTRGPHHGRLDRAEPLARPTRTGVPGRAIAVRRLIASGAMAALILAAVPLANAVVGPPLVSKAVDGSVFVTESASRSWLARFEVRTTGDNVDFGYLEMFGVGGDVAGQNHQYQVDSVDYYKTATGAQGATLHMQECIIDPWTPCAAVDYDVSDGASVGKDDTFLDSLGWVVTGGNISIYDSNVDNPIFRVGRAKVLAGHRYVDVDLRSQGGLGSSPRCFAELQTYRSGVWVTACRPNYPVTGKARIYLNKAVSKATHVAWNITNN
jgi:hypothetical protein